MNCKSKFVQYMCICYTYTTGSSSFPDIAARGYVRIYQANAMYMYHIAYAGYQACQCKFENWIYIWTAYGNSIMGQHVQAATHVIPMFVNKNG